MKKTFFNKTNPNQMIRTLFPWQLLTEYDGKLLVLVDQHVQHLVSHFLNLVGFDLVDEPFKHLVLFRQVTVEDGRNRILKVHQPAGYIL
jgi:hypothetical protein